MLNLDQQLVDAALTLSEQRAKAGLVCSVAALRVARDRIITSVYFSAPVEGASLCAETGAICEAERLGERITASVCVGRASADSAPYLLPACGLCQERLARWGLDVEIAVPVQPGSMKWEARRLADLQPHHWLRHKRRNA